MDFVVLIQKSYNANLTLILIVQWLQPTFIDIKEVKKNGSFVGYQNDSFVKGLLIKQLDFNESKLKPYVTLEEYHEALSKGIHNFFLGGGGVVLLQFLMKSPISSSSLQSFALCILWLDPPIKQMDLVLWVSLSLNKTKNKKNPPLSFF